MEVCMQDVATSGGNGRLGTSIPDVKVPDIDFSVLQITEESFLPKAANHGLLTSKYAPKGEDHVQSAGRPCTEKAPTGPKRAVLAYSYVRDRQRSRYPLPKRLQFAPGEKFRGDRYRPRPYTSLDDVPEHLRQGLATGYPEPITRGSSGSSSPIRKRRKDEEGDVDMADHERDDGPRGGRRDRGDREFRGHRKRRYRDDEYDERPQRRRYQEPFHMRLRKRLLSIGDAGIKDISVETREIAELFCENYDEEADVRSVFLDLIVQMIVEQPFKVPCTAAMLMYANDLKPAVVEATLKKATEKLQEALEAGHWRDVKLLLRFFAYMQQMFQDDGVFPVLDELFNRAVDLQAASQDDAVGIELVKIILLTIPYALIKPTANLQQKAKELLEKTEIVASAPHPVAELLQAYNGAEEDLPLAHHSLIGMLQQQLMKESENNWPLAVIPRWYQPKAKEDEEAATSQKHSFPAIIVPSPVNAGPKPLFPETYLSLYETQDVETVPSPNHIASSLLRDALVDTINILDFNRTAVAKFLIEMDCYWAPDTFIKRGTAFDKLREVAGPDGSTWKPEDLAVDAVFSQILKLPTAEHKLVYYHTVITDSCKIAPAAIAPSLGRAIRFLFRNLDKMDMELGYRFMDWFAHHLSNFEFRWKWSEWIDDIALPDQHARKSFLIGILDKEIRLSFAKRIREAIPPQYHPLIPAEKDKDIPDFKYTDDRSPYAPEGRDLLALLKKKAPEEELQQVIDKIHEQAAEHGVADTLIPSTDAYMTSICFIGSKSLSHVLSCIERCKVRLNEIGASSDAAKRQIISSVVDYWKDQPGTAVNIVDKLLNYGIIAPASVIQWALVDRIDAGRALSQPWVYEMVSGTVHKVTNRVRQIAAARLTHAMLDEALTTERASQRQLFQLIDDAVSGVANGSNDALIEAQGKDEMAGGLSEERARLVRKWGARWQRVFKRKAAVEESVVGEQAMVARIVASERDAANSAAMAVDGDGEGINGAGGADAVVNGNGAGDGETADMIS